jgi:hypothetical protein
MFLEGQIRGAIPATPLATDVLNIPALVTNLAQKANTSTTYSISATDAAIAAAALSGPTGAQGPPGNDSQVAGPAGPTGTQGAQGNSIVGSIGPTGAVGAQGNSVQGVPGATGATGPAGGGGGSGITTGEQTWLNSAQNALTVASNKCTALKLASEAAIWSYTVNGSIDACIYPRFGSVSGQELMILRGGPTGCLFQNTSSQSILNLNNDKTVDFLGDLRLYNNSSVNTALKIRSTSASGQPSISFGTPSTGQIGSDKCSISAYGLNSSSRSQLCFNVLGGTWAGSADSSTCSMLVDGYGRCGIKTPVGEEPGYDSNTRLDCRDGNLEISTTTFAN